MNLMISKYLKFDVWSLRNCVISFSEPKLRRKAACAQYTYTVTPIPCYLFPAAQLVRTKNWSLLSSHSKNQEIADGRVKYDRIRGCVG